MIILWFRLRYGLRYISRRVAVVFVVNDLQIDLLM